MMRKALIVLTLLCAPLPAVAQTYTISPPPFLLAQNNSGTIINNACIWTYTAGTVNAATTYADAAGTPNSNPIRSDSAGRFTAFLSPGNSYKYVYESACTPPAHGTVLKTSDNISAMPPSGVNVDITGTAGESINVGAVAYISDGSGSLSVGQWYNASSSNAYASNTATIVGFATSAVTTGNTGSFRIAGRVTGLTGLSTGTSYYIASAAGTTTGTAPTNARLLGIADSTTSLVIDPNPKNTTATLNSIAEGRLSSTTATCIPTTDVSAITAIFYTFCTGNHIALYDGVATWNIKTFTELTITTVGCTASKPYDVFLYDNAGVVASEILVWTDATNRATALVRQDGVWVKSGATTRRFVGSFYCNGTGGQTDDTLLKRSVCNMYNRTLRPVRIQEPADSWTYTTAAFRQVNANAANQIDAMICIAELSLSLQATHTVNNTNGGVSATTGIGEDSTTVLATECINQVMLSVAASPMTLAASLAKKPAVGRHLYQWLEFSSATGTATWYGDNGSPTIYRNGVSGWIED